ncbi:arylacetamide deacetylase isoform X1 [Tachysurus fulvidraco]|uniref:arylacetamide deacetylase isoform X1 n=2 Tax=Tachysurus fulvidraco TaxID=1234273 RepID=UPI000F4F89DA|nr:arylacetamide deacetylase isoform X1 [Tachysurus fulvidraco]
MRSIEALVLLSACALTAYYIYTPVPDNIEQRWKLMITDCFFRSLSHLADFSELLGLTNYMDVMMFVTFLERVVPVSDERVKVAEERFDGVEVVVYEPRHERGTGERRRAIIYLHGGGWCLGSSKMGPYDLLSRQMVTELNAVVVSVEYRLAPPYHFPVPFEDVYRVVKYFLQSDVLDRYEVDPERVAVSGDSAGGNLAAAVTQQLQLDPNQRVKLKAQALIYPALQALDLNTPSYQQNRHMPILPRTLMVRFWSEYFTSDKAFFTAMLTNNHNGAESVPMLKFVNWSVFLPEEYRRTYKYNTMSVTTDKTSLSLTDPRASPLLMPEAVLRQLPKTYILTCEYDVLRDDGVMYVTRLRLAGVDVTHEHYEEAFHGTLMFTLWPTEFEVARRMTDNYLLWLKENL